MLSLAFYLLALCFSLAFSADVSLFSLFLGDSVVLQSGAGGARVWGGAAPNAKLLLSLDGSPAGSAVADGTGRWEALLPAQAPSWNVLVLTVSDAAGGGAQAVASLRFGTTLLCSGQSVR